jgi:diguanylate cyclase (GGDEF)-like protein
VNPRTDPAGRFALAVVGSALAFVGIVGSQNGLALLGHPDLTYILFSAIVILGELFVLRLPSRADDVTLSASSMFAYATAICFGPGPAMASLSVAAVLRGLRLHRPPIKNAFNASQHAITVGLAGLTYQALRSTPLPLAPASLAAALAGALVYLLVNYTLTGTVVALATGAPVRQQLARGFSAWLPVEGVMLGFSPVVAVVADRSLEMLPLLLLPFLGVVYSGRIAFAAEHAAVHDALTDLPNRVLFRARVEQALSRAQHTGDSIVVMVLDLNGFKEVNDTLGHGRGDDLLRAIADRLRRALRGADLVARLGGDEFGVLLTTPSPGGIQPSVLAERISEALETPFQLGDLWVNSGTSIGIAVSPQDGTSAERLLQRADVAMYLAKAANTGFERYDPDRDPNRPDNLRLLQDLRAGIERGELVLHYQPKLSLTDGRVTGTEALARWQHPDRGLLMPGQFIELAERSELLRAVTLCVVRQAARQMNQWRAAGLDLPVAVNLSPRSLLDVTLPADIAAILAEEGLPPELLEVEVTESCLISDPDRTAEVLGRLNATGVRISIDDFGTGYSSLALLKRLPVDAIKIDASFVRNLAQGTDDMAIVESTVRLASGLGITCVAEGVEDGGALDLLTDYGCDEAQGYHLCRPLPPAEVFEWLRQRREPLDLTSAQA